MSIKKVLSILLCNRQYLEIRKGMCGLPHASVVANKLPKERLMMDGYKEVLHTPGLFKHKTQEICFTLVVDALRIKYGNKNNIKHLLQTLKKHYEIETG